MISGIIVAYFNIPPFVATLGMQMSVRGAVYLLTDGMTISENRREFQGTWTGICGATHPEPGHHHDGLRGYLLGDSG
ncbi:MAG: hypothetical protein V8Q27_10235 [Eubacteriales bacterium]